jgi:UDP-2-acetamido-2,6-beta-L-arabino-hexul-4-ose reductase
MKKVLILGKNGFLGSHLEMYFKFHLKYEVLDFNREDWSNLEYFLNEADLVIFNSCVIKGDNIFEENKQIVDNFVNVYKNLNKKIDIIVISSLKRLENSNYGKSKLYAEEKITEVSSTKHDNVKIIVAPNIFGPFAKPNYNSAVATFCFNEINNLQSISNNNVIELVYVNDLVKLISDESIFDQNDELIVVSNYVKTYFHTANEILTYIKNIKIEFDKQNFNFYISDIYKKLYITYLSYIPPKNFIINHDLKSDERGWLFEYNNYELQKTDHLFISSTNPLKMRGNHFHFNKFEKFTFLKGKLKLNFQNIRTKEKFSFLIDKTPQTIIIPPLLAHNIESLEENSESIILFYSNEKFNPKDPDTYYYEIQ